MIKITTKLINKNYSARKDQNIKYIVIHDTANKSKGADAEAHYNYFNNNVLDKSAHYIIDSKQILQIIDDKNKSWHCGDGHGKNGITNDNSIGLEICVNCDGDYDKAIKKAQELSAYLLKKYNLSIDNLVRHNDASGKICPNSMYNNNWDKWQEFKAKVNNILDNKDIYLTADKIKMYIIGTYNIFLERDPDQEGFFYWCKKINDIETLKNFLMVVIDSQEFKKINGK